MGDGTAHKQIAPTSEARKMGGEWSSISILQHWEILVLNDANHQRIIPPREYRETIISSLHNSTGRKADTLITTMKKFYFWPRMREDIHQHIAACRTCLVLMPGKTRSQALGLDVDIADLQPMDWLVTDLFSSPAVSGGKKKDWIVIGDRHSGFCWAQELSSTKTNNIIDALNTFNREYSGPPYRISSDGGPQYSAINAKISDWAKSLGINHQISAAFSPQSNGESEACVKRAKQAINHALLEKQDVKAAIANSNNLQRCNGQGSPAELFFKRATRLPGGLATLPSHKYDFSTEIAKRSAARDKQCNRTKNLREPTTFSIGERVAIRDTQSGKWSSVGQIESKREHGGLGVRSYTLTNIKTGKLIARNERHLRKLTNQKEEEIPRRGRVATPPDIPPPDNESRMSDEESVYAVRPVHTKPEDTDNHRTQRLISQDTQSNTVPRAGVTHRDSKYRQRYASRIGYKMVKSKNTTDVIIKSILKSGSTLKSSSIQSPPP